MNDLEKMIMEEISTLDELRLIDILGFIRYLKAEKPIKQDWIVGWFDNAIQSNSCFTVHNPTFFSNDTIGYVLAGNTGANAR